MSRFENFLEACDGSGKMDGTGKKKRKRKGKMDENLEESVKLTVTLMRIEDRLKNMINHIKELKSDKRSYVDYISELSKGVGVLKTLSNEYEKEYNRIHK